MQGQRMETSSKLHLFILLVICGYLIPAGVYGRVKRDTFSLKDCIQFTLQHHPNSSIYRNNARVAEEKVRDSRAAFLPTVSGNASFDYNIRLQTTVIPAGALSATETKLQMGSKLSTGAYLQGDQTLFDKTATLDMKASKVDKEIADLNVLKENETLMYNTAKAFYEVLTYGEKGRLLRENEVQYIKLLEILKLRYEQGVVKKSEYDRTRVDLNNIQAELSLNDNYYELSLNKLKNAMGLDLEALLIINGHVDYSIKPDIPPLNEMNVSQLSDYRIDEKNLLQKEIEMKKKRAAFLPTMSLYAKYGANAYGAEFSSAFDRWFDYSVVGVKLSVPIFSGFRKNSQLKQSKINVETQKLTLGLNTRNYQLDFQNAGSQLLNSYTSLLKNSENLALAREVRDATAIEFSEGAASMSSYLDADYSFKETQSNYITSLFDFLNARIALEKANGNLVNYVQNLK